MGILDWIILAVVVILAVLAVRRIRKKGNGCGIIKLYAVSANIHFGRRTEYERNISDFSDLPGRAGVPGG